MKKLDKHIAVKVSDMELRYIDKIIERKGVKNKSQAIRLALEHYAIQLSIEELYENGELAILEGKTK